MKFDFVQFDFDQTFDPKVVTGHCDLISLFDII